MLKIPPPPDPPQSSEQWLNELATYYRQLVSYHQQAAQTAARQLAHLEVLLGYDPQLESQDWLTEAQTIDSTQKRLDLASFPQLSPYESNSTKGLIKQIAALLVIERGHVLHIDYIVRKLYGQPNSENLDSLKAEVMSALEEGEAQRMWSSVPDAPDCWTLDQDELTPIDKEETTLTTAEVIRLLNISQKTLSRIKSKYAEELLEGTHYLVDSRNWHHWKSAGVELLRNLVKQSNQTSRSKAR
ncbi:hypothetical protein [Chroococcus sp. FPU101]|uniref:hypothetical protein n=1 Tax=Chroococcus sp. FPU101 TaxID=1974212 RepID=UPI001A8F120C|nr:hypothetical protein [Chroococcus sp. FPU101]GFE71070.1 hypothetical protein CFPU101_36800 [Chroococcus sp. FPU101]